MENVSKALLMAGSVLLTIMIITFTIYLYTTLGDDTRNINDTVLASQRNEFNNQFLQYFGDQNVRAHTIVSIANLARKNNEKYIGNDYTDTSPEIGRGYYISVIIDGSGMDTKYKLNHFENQEHPYVDDATYNDFIKDYGSKWVYREEGIPLEWKWIPDPQYFECVEVTVNNETKYVDTIRFRLIP